jgi:replication-associated recombination protein RarA
MKRSASSLFDEGCVWQLPDSIRETATDLFTGAPGIGKTAIVSQVASEMGISLVSYSMTHHTRQSAIGLPFIEHKNTREKNLMFPSIP